MAGDYKLDAFDYADKLNLLDIVFYRIGGNNILEARLWVYVVLFFLIAFLVSMIFDKLFGEAKKEDEFLLNGTTTSGRSIVEFVIAWFILSYSIGFIKPEINEVRSRLNASTHYEKIFIRYK